MDRVNRSILAIATLIAVPTALVMTSMSTGDSPEVSQAIALHSDGAGAIQQVVGKELESRQTRPGLLQVITGSRTQGSRDHRHENMPQAQPKGLLDTLFESRSNASRNQPANHNHKNATHNHATHNHGQTTAPRNSDWEGIPYHQVDSSRPETNNRPIRDPNEMSGEATRVIRGGSTSARTVSSRRPSNEPSLAPTPAPPLAVPTPPSELEPLPEPINSYASPSSSTSSRRSNRRSLEPLDPAEIAAAANGPTDLAASPREVTELVPRVPRKQIEAESKPNVAAKPTTSQSVEAPSLTTQAPDATDIAAVSPEEEPALAAIGSPLTNLQEPVSLSEQATMTPDSVALSQSDATAAESTVVPDASIPTQPYAASTPSATVPSRAASHRSGPPSDAFQPTQPRFSPTSSPVGTGVANSDVASFRSETITPSTTGTTSPYQIPLSNAGSATRGTMTTFGQPIATPADRDGDESIANAPILPTETNALSAPAADNFARSEYEARNRMRDAVNANPGTAASASELPGIRVMTYGPATMMLRQNSQYEIRVENRGAIDANGLMVRATVPQWAELRSRNATRGNIDHESKGSTDYLVWKIDHLPAGSAEQMLVRLTATKSGTFNLDVDWTLIPQKSVAQIQVHEPKLSLTIEGPEEVVFGKSQTYKFRVLNPGDGTAPNVVFTLSPNSATPQSQRIGDIPPGKEAQFDVELTAQDLGDLQIHGLASGDLDLRTEAVKTIKVAAAKLEAILTGPQLKYQNTEAIYSLQLQNTGAAACEKVVASLRLPNGVKYLGGMDDATLQGNNLKWEVTSLPPGATRDYQFRCSMTSTGEHLFAFDCSGTAAGRASVAIATRVESIADLVLTVSDPPAPAPVGTEVSYEILIRNRGSKDAVDVKTIAQFSHGIEPQRIEGHSGEVVTGQVLFDEIPRIGAGQEVRIRVIAKAETAGHHRFRTEVHSGDTVLVAEEATHYLSSKSERVSRRSSDGANH